MARLKPITRIKSIGLRGKKKVKRAGKSAWKKITGRFARRVSPEEKQPENA